MDLMEAKQRLENLRLKDGATINCRVSLWGVKWSAEFSVWDGNQHHTDPSLECAIKKAEEANRRHNEAHGRADSFFDQAQ